MELDKSYQIKPIGFIHSPFKEKFGIPRQAGLVSDTEGVIELVVPFNRVEMVADLSGYSHIWVEFIFHKVAEDEWKASVRPPRLGGNKKVGVLASRSPFRPNRLGLSVVALHRIDCSKGRVRLYVAGLDLLDQTPVVDIKPYVVYADSHPQAVSGYASERPVPMLEVVFSDKAQQQLTTYTDHVQMYKVIEGVLALDPRPAYQRKQADVDRIYGMKLYDMDIQWQVKEGKVEVLAL